MPVTCRLECPVSDKPCYLRALEND